MGKLEFKGTKGEWIVKHSQSKNAWNVVGTVVGSRYKIARCPYLFVEDVTKLNEREKNEQEANAKLTAAAPELLEALKLSNEWLKKLLPFINKEMKDAWEFGIDKNEKAIEKALK